MSRLADVSTERYSDPEIVRFAADGVTWKVARVDGEAVTLQALVAPHSTLMTTREGFFRDRAAAIREGWILPDPRTPRVLPPSDEVPY